MENLVVILTGASKGIGRETARQLAHEGAQVYGVARSTRLLQALADDTSTFSGRVYVATADVTSRSDVERVVKQVHHRHGRIDLLINNAGVERVKPIDDFSDEDYDATMDTNLRGTFLFTRAVVPLMKSQGAGQIINIASLAGIRGFADDTVYCASKFGVVGFSEALDEELRPHGIRVSCVAPGAVNTALAADTWSPPDDPYRPHFLQPDDVARVILFVARQPAHVTIPLVKLLPLVEPPYSALLSLEEQGGRQT